MLKWLMIFLGGGVGAFMRYLTGELVVLFVSNSFPVATLVVNAVGCLLYGMAGAMLKTHHPNWLSAFVLIGLLGGYTTFSTYMADVVGLVELNRMALVFLTVLLQTGFGFLAFMLGRWLVV